MTFYIGCGLHNNGKHSWRYFVSVYDSFGRIEIANVSVPVAAVLLIYDVSYHAEDKFRGTPER
jgi:hypothetical protein